MPALYGLTGINDGPGVARILLEAGADPTDGESVFHAAERFHEASLELLLEHGVDLNATRDWGNTPLYFLLRWWDVATQPRVERGMRWLLEHGADPNVLCDERLRESSLHVAVRRGQHPDVVERLLERGADIGLRRGDGRTAWVLARRGGHDTLVALLERRGARAEPLSRSDGLLAACGRGDAEAARARATNEARSALDASDLGLVTEAASRGRFDTVRACVAAGLPVDVADERGATALHFAAIHGCAATVRALLGRGADHTIRDVEHRSTPLGWAFFGADHVREQPGEYAATVRALLEAGARARDDEHAPEDPAVRGVLRAYPYRVS